MSRAISATSGPPSSLAFCRNSWIAAASTPDSFSVSGGSVAAVAAVSFRSRCVPETFAASAAIRARYSPGPIEPFRSASRRRSRSAARRSRRSRSPSTPSATTAARLRLSAAAAIRRANRRSLTAAPSSAAWTPTTPDRRSPGLTLPSSAAGCPPDASAGAGPPGSLTAAVPTALDGPADSPTVSTPNAPTVAAAGSTTLPRTAATTTTTASAGLIVPVIYTPFHI